MEYPKIQYVNRPSTARESQLLEKELAIVLQGDLEFKFRYVVTFTGTINGLDNFNLDTYRVKEDKVEYITTLHTGDKERLINLVTTEISSEILPTLTQGIYTYEYSEHYL